MVSHRRDEQMHCKQAQNEILSDYASSDSSLPITPSVRELISSISRVYTSSSPKWETITALSEHLGWDSLTNTTVSEYLSSQYAVSEKYINEVVEAATRVNYGQVR